MKILKIKKLWVNWGKPIVFAALPTTIIIGSLRMLGWLQPLELAAYDLLFQLRPPLPPDSRVIIVGLE